MYVLLLPVWVPERSSTQELRFSFSQSQILYFRILKNETTMINITISILYSSIIVVVIHISNYWLPQKYSLFSVILSMPITNKKCESERIGFVGRCKRDKEIETDPVTDVLWLYMRTRLVFVFPLSKASCVFCELSFSPMMTWTTQNQT